VMIDAVLLSIPPVPSVLILSSSVVDDPVSVSEDVVPVPVPVTVFEEEVVPVPVPVTVTYQK